MAHIPFIRRYFCSLDLIRCYSFCHRRSLIRLGYAGVTLLGTGQ